MTNEHLDDEAISAHLDGAATPEEAAHVEGCPTCSARLSSFRAAATAIGSPVEVPVAAREAAIAAALDALPSAAATGSRSNVVPFRRRGLPPWLSVAAALLVVVALVPLLGSLGGGSDDADETASSDEALTEEAQTFDDDAATGLVLAPIEGGDVGAVDAGSVRTLVEDALRSGDPALRATSPAEGGGGDAEQEESGDAAATGGAAEDAAPSPAPAPCEDVAASEFADLGALRYRALGTFEDEPVSILAYELVDGGGRLRVLVYAVETCTIRVAQELEPS